MLGQPDTFILMQEAEFSYALAIEEGQFVRSTRIFVDDELIFDVGAETGRNVGLSKR